LWGVAKVAKLVQGGEPAYAKGGTSLSSGSTFRIRIEHVIGGVKRDKIVKDKIRLLKDGIRYTIQSRMIQIACGGNLTMTSMPGMIARCTGQGPGGSMSARHAWTPTMLAHGGVPAPLPLGTCSCLAQSRPRLAQCARLAGARYRSQRSPRGYIPPSRITYGHPS
jgi:hypothetical protein